jgi:hypothetical protein
MEPNGHGGCDVGVIVTVGVDVTVRLDVTVGGWM